jgi:hypothetical protein
VIKLHTDTEKNNKSELLICRFHRLRNGSRATKNATRYHLFHESVVSDLRSMILKTSIIPSFVRLSIIPSSSLIQSKNPEFLPAFISESEHQFLGWNQNISSSVPNDGCVARVMVMTPWFILILPCTASRMHRVTKSRQT